MANFPTSPATGSYFTTSGTTYKYVGPGIWQVAAPDSEVKMSVIQDDHTKLLLKFDGLNNSTTFTDSSRHNRTISTSGHAKILTASYAFGTSSAYFDGTGDYLTIPDSPDWDFGTGDFTIEAWVKTNSYAVSDEGNSWSPRILNRGQWNTNEGFLIWWNSATSFTYAIGGPGVEVTSAGITDNIWHHIAIVRSGTNVYAFLDGVLKNTETGNSNNISSSEPLYIGGRYDGGDGGYMTGYLDGIRISNVARHSGSFDINTGSMELDFHPQQAQPADETSNLQTLTLQSSSISIPDAKTTDVQLYVDNPGADSYTKLLLHFDGGDEATSGVGFTDSSPSSHTVHISGSTKIDNGASVFGTSSIYFDGTGDYIGTSSLTLDGDFTVEAWVNPTAVADFRIFCWGDDKDSTGLVVYRSGFGGGALYVNGNDSNIIAASADLTAGTWQHIALVRVGSALTLYKDGVSVGSATNSTSFTGAAKFGVELYDGVFYPTSAGYIDEVRVSDTARYTTTFDPPKKQFGRPDLKLKDGSGTYTIKLKQIN